MAAASSLTMVSEWPVVCCWMWSMASSMSAQNFSATSLCTSTVSSALQTLGRWVLAFMAIARATSRSAVAST
ncbi:Uncharacterised protein [Mycobacteroides abscessus subsp. abscessus]|nr:Uncharacterised protein [Mycobacteroides abscessus subsp. abscessus]